MGYPLWAQGQSLVTTPLLGDTDVFLVRVEQLRGVSGPPGAQFQREGGRAGDVYVPLPSS